MPAPDEIAAEYLNRQSSFDFGRVMVRGVRLVVVEPWSIVGATWLICLVFVALQLVPLLGWVAAMVIGPSLFGGLGYLLVRRFRGEPARVGDLFVAFNDRATVMQLAIAGAVVSLLVAAGILLLILPGIYLAVGYTFTFVLVLDKKLEFWPAMELSRRVVHRHWFAIFFVLLLSAIIAMLGVLAVLVGVVVTLPMAFAAQMSAYEELFGEPPAASAAV